VLQFTKRPHLWFWEISPVLHFTKKKKKKKLWVWGDYSYDDDYQFEKKIKEERNIN
jgi:hypothetical protein